MTKLTRRGAVALLLPALLGPILLSSGCARYPQNTIGGSGGKQLVVTMRVRGRIRTTPPPDLPGAPSPTYYYFALINFTDDVGDAGPVPVVNIPWGNGFAAPAPLPANRQGFVGFVRIDAFQQQGYGVYRVPATDPSNPDSPLFNPVTANFERLGLPDRYSPLAAGDAVISFQLDLSRLPAYLRNRGNGTRTPARYVQINLLATNNLPQGADENAPKAWDALGDGRDTGAINTWLIIPLDQDVVQTNEQTNLEPAGDVREKLGAAVEDPDLDIVGWTVEIRSQ